MVVRKRVSFLLMKVLVVTFFFMFIFLKSVSSQGQTQSQMYLTSVSLSPNEPCPSNMVQEFFPVNRSETSTSGVYLCKSYSSFSAGLHYINDSLVAKDVCPRGYDTDEIGGVEAGWMTIEYESGSERILFCTSKVSATSTSGLLKNASLFLNSCPEGFEDRGNFSDFSSQRFFYCISREAVTVNPGGGGAQSNERICSDSDGSIADSAKRIGYNINRKGLTFPFGSRNSERNTTVLKDVCLSDYILKEYYCNADSLETSETFSEQVSCENKCSDGRCLAMGEAWPGIGESPAGCVDADRGVANYTAGSYVDYFENDGRGKRFYDHCLSQNTLVEYSCSDSGEVRREEVTCNCSNGYCTGSVANGCGSYQGIIFEKYPFCEYSISLASGEVKSFGAVLKLADIGTVVKLAGVGMVVSKVCPNVSCQCTSDRSKGQGTGWNCTLQEQESEQSNRPEQPNCKILDLPNTFESGNEICEKENLTCKGPNCNNRLIITCKGCVICCPKETGDSFTFGDDKQSYSNCSTFGLKGLWRQTGRERCEIEGKVCKTGCDLSMFFGCENCVTCCSGEGSGTGGGGLLSSPIALAVGGLLITALIGLLVWKFFL